MYADCQQGKKMPKKKWRETYDDDGSLILIERQSDRTFSVTVTRKRDFVGDAIGFATKDYAYNYGIRLLREFPEKAPGKK
jgi:hypothetical protein